MEHFSGKMKDLADKAKKPITAVAAAAILAPSSISAEASMPVSPDNAKAATEQAASAGLKESRSALVSHDTLAKDISYTLKEDTAKKETHAIDTMRAEIEKKMDAPTPAVVTEAKTAEPVKAKETIEAPKPVHMEIEAYKSVLRSIIEDTLSHQKKKNKTKLTDLKLTNNNGHLSFVVTMETPKPIGNPIEVEVLGTLEEKDHILSVGKSMVEAPFGFQGLVEKSINPILSAFGDMTASYISKLNGGKKVKSITRAQDGVVVSFEPGQ